MSRTIKTTSSHFFSPRSLFYCYGLKPQGETLWIEKTLEIRPSLDATVAKAQFGKGHNYSSSHVPGARYPRLVWALLPRATGWPRWAAGHRRMIPRQEEPVLFQERDSGHHYIAEDCVLSIPPVDVHTTIFYIYKGAALIKDKSSVGLFEMHRASPPLCRMTVFSLSHLLGHTAEPCVLLSN